MSKAGEEEEMNRLTETLGSCPKTLVFSTAYPRRKESFGQKLLRGVWKLFENWQWTDLWMRKRRQRKRRDWRRSCQLRGSKRERASTTHPHSFLKHSSETRSLRGQNEDSFPSPFED